MGIKELYKYFKSSSGVSIDSRTIGPGELFFALKGPNFDGHKYIESAFDNGAKYALIEDPNYENLNNVLLVDNVEEALQGLARYHRCMLQIPVIGITGSNGKTTTKELMASVLSTQFEVFATKGNLNNHLGVPLSILYINNSHELAIIEMGANHLKEIEFLCRISMPDFGLITNIGKAHLEGFRSVDGVRIGKTELYQYLAQSGGTIFYNEDDKNLAMSLPAATENIVYSMSDVKLLETHPMVKFKYDEMEFNSNLNGDFNLINMVAAITVGKHFGIELANLKKGIEDYIPKNNRSQIMKTERNLLILDAYNANPSSMAASISNFAGHPGEKKVLILGHMLELGESSMEEHLKLVELVAQHSWDWVFLVGSEFVNIQESIPFEIYPDVNELSERIKGLDMDQHTILLKGSRGVALERCVEFL